MDSTQHTVTIPIADYNELLEFKRLNASNTYKAHLELISKAIEIIGLEPEWEPLEVIFERNPARSSPAYFGDNKPQLLFKYKI